MTKLKYKFKTKEVEFIIENDDRSDSELDEILSQRALDIRKHSITPSTFKERSFSDDDLIFTDTYSFKDRKILRFGINKSAIDFEVIADENTIRLRNQKKELTKSDSSAYDLVLPVIIENDLASEFFDPAAAGGGGRIRSDGSSPAGSASPASSGGGARPPGSSPKTSDSKKYTQEDAKEVVHTESENYVMRCALEYLRENNVVLVDILERSCGSIRVKNGELKTHTILLLRGEKVGDTHKVFVIDPNNFIYSSHLSNPDMVSSIGDLAGEFEIITLHKTLQIYKAPPDKYGYAPDLYRNCVDVAAKLGMMFIGEDLSSFRDIKTIIGSDIVNSVSNLGNKYLDQFCPARAAQSSDPLISETYNKLSSVLLKFIKICDLVLEKSEMVAKFEDEYKSRIGISEDVTLFQDFITQISGEIIVELQKESSVIE